MMILENKFEIGQTVYLKADKEQLPRLVYCMNVLPGEQILYELSQGPSTSRHYDFEISTEKNALVEARVE